MQIENIRCARHRQVGVTLIELMVSIVLGILLMLAATAMTVSSMMMNADTLNSARLNQNLDSVVQVMVNDIRRAGYTGGLFDFGDKEDLNIISVGGEPSCLLYAYDTDQPLAVGAGSIQADERFGFKLVGTAIEMRTTCPDSSGTACWLNCSSGTWVVLTDTDIVAIDASTGLKFDSFNSKCLNITSSTKNYWVTSATGEDVFPCAAESADAGNLTNYIRDSVTGVYATGTFAEPITGDSLVESRQVNVQIAGALANDPSFIKTQRVAINIRNNRSGIKP